MYIYVGLYLVGVSLHAIDDQLTLNVKTTSGLEYVLEDDGAVDHHSHNRMVTAILWVNAQAGDQIYLTTDDTEDIKVEPAKPIVFFGWKF